LRASSLSYSTLLPAQLEDRRFALAVNRAAQGDDMLALLQHQEHQSHRLTRTVVATAAPTRRPAFCPYSMEVTVW
jgi:hypothetical protein